MHSGQCETGIEVWLAEVRAQFTEEAPDLLPLFDIYCAEALFGRRYIASDLDHLPDGARILEVGAGSFLLSCQLKREGFSVVALEPTGDGFSHFNRMRQIVLKTAQSLGCQPSILDMPAERLADQDWFDYAFSVNVMEHVNDVALVLKNVGRSLVIGASYRFTCPNYFFPYEPHFNIPTFFSKRLTAYLLGRQIFGSNRVTDPAGTWQSLNWINVLHVSRCVRQLPDLKLTFDRSILTSTLDRMVSDSGFAGRRSPLMRRLLGGLVSLRIHNLLRYVPVTMQPLMDCRIKKVISPEVF